MTTRPADRVRAKHPAPNWNGSAVYRLAEALAIILANGVMSFGCLRASDLLRRFSWNQTMKLSAGHVIHVTAPINGRARLKTVFWEPTFPPRRSAHRGEAWRGYANNWHQRKESNPHGAVLETGLRPARADNGMGKAHCAEYLNNRRWCLLTVDRGRHLRL